MSSRRNRRKVGKVLQSITAIREEVDQVTERPGSGWLGIDTAGDAEHLCHIGGITIELICQPSSICAGDLIPGMA